MPKKIFAIFLVISAIFVLSLVYINKKYNARLARQKLYEQAQNAKGEEISITLIEGWSNKDIAEYLEKQGIMPASDFLMAVKNFNLNAFSNTIPKESAGSLQGFLYPDTYRIFKSLTDRSKTSASDAANQIISKLLNNFKTKLPADAQDLAQKQNLSLFQAITLASIVEKETGRNVVTSAQKANLDVERKIIADIFYNRLRAGMPLQSDATINYITGKNDPGVSDADLAIKSAYNTYQNKGLPPGPICNPSLSSILAVLNPTATDYFYFLHKQPSGEPVYAKTFEEHLANKNRYLK